jgi:hypothetical protein
MNERIKELAEQAGFLLLGGLAGWRCHTNEIERFAELVRQDEREICAKVCDKQAKIMLELIGLPVVTSEIIQRDRAEQWVKCAAAIRAKEQA